MIFGGCVGSLNVGNHQRLGIDELRCGLRWIGHEPGLLVDEVRGENLVRWRPQASGCNGLLFARADHILFAHRLPRLQPDIGQNNGKT